MLKRTGIGSDTGSGTAVAVATLYPIFILVIVTISLLSGSGRIDQVLQNAANRAARTASLCCEFTPEAEQAARASLLAAEDAAASNRIFCNNDLIGDSRVAFVDVSGNDVTISPDESVPPGGAVYVFLSCRVPPEVLGGVGLPGLDVMRRAEGVAIVSPYRARSGG